VRQHGTLATMFAGSLALAALAPCAYAARQAQQGATANTPLPTTAADRAAAEARVIGYVRDHLKPGQPLVVTELYNKVFTQPAERQALDKLYRAFFRIPLFVAQYQDKFGHPPSLETISEQFDLRAPGAADVLLRVMEFDPRVPKFFSRDPATGQITKVDVALIRSDPRFAQMLAHQLGGWEGERAPAFSLPGLNVARIDSADLAGKAVLLYVWFTGCPPCIQEAPVLVGLNQQLGGRGFEVVGANADRELGLGYTDAVRKHYLAEHHVDFPVGEWTKAADAAYSGISIFPTLFLIDSNGIIRAHWVGFVGAAGLRAAITKVKAGS
jgi:thiol-disulfide isomerase/thioredoxin